LHTTREFAPGQKKLKIKTTMRSKKETMEILEQLVRQDPYLLMWINMFADWDLRMITGNKITILFNPKTQIELMADPRTGTIIISKSKIRFNPETETYDIPQEKEISLTLNPKTAQRMLNDIFGKPVIAQDMRKDPKSFKSRREIHNSHHPTMDPKTKKQKEPMQED
jgi:hypothetical protein